MTFSAKIPNCELNLWNIERYLELDDQIIGIKTNNGFKGSYWTNKYKRSKSKKINYVSKNTFLNQITVIIHTHNNYINLKIFKNGSLHLTGCKNIEMTRETITILLNRLRKLIDIQDKILLSKDENGVLLDKNNFIYSYDDLRPMIIGYVGDQYYNNNKIYTIWDKNYTIDKKTNMFISDKIETKRKYKILNLSGNEIGYKQITLTSGSSKFYNKYINYDNENDLLYHKDIVIGKIEYVINNDLITQLNNIDDIIEIDYSCNPFITGNDYLIYENYNNNFDQFFSLTTNCINVSFDLNKRLNRDKLYKSLTDDNYICKYNPEIYSGIKLVYKMSSSNDELNGKCQCSKNCTCNEIVFLIFQTGKVLATGFKQTQIINKICNNFKNICEKYGDKILRKEIN